MSSNLSLNIKADLSTNPNNFPPNAFFNSNILSDCANKIQRAVRNRDVRRSVKRIKQSMKDQTYRTQIISCLSNFISLDTCYKPLLGSDDVEIVSTFSIYDKNHVTVKARHIADALTILAAVVNTENPISRLKCCELATIKNYNRNEVSKLLSNCVRLYSVGKK